jgi:hypothetical protein
MSLYEDDFASALEMAAHQEQVREEKQRRRRMASHVKGGKSRQQAQQLEQGRRKQERGRVTAALLLPPLSSPCKDVRVASLGGKQSRQREWVEGILTTLLRAEERERKRMRAEAAAAAVAGGEGATATAAAAAATVAAAGCTSKDVKHVSTSSGALIFHLPHAAPRSGAVQGEEEKEGGGGGGGGGGEGGEGDGCPLMLAGRAYNPRASVVAGFPVYGACVWARKGTDGPAYRRALSTASEQAAAVEEGRRLAAEHTVLLPVGDTCAGCVLVVRVCVC